MKHLPILILILILTAAGNTSAQEIRYLDPVFEEISTTTVAYADQLKLDLYLPEGDTLKKRPVILYVHGGGFSGGSRDYGEIPEFCKKLAARGYAAASMSYRLTMKDRGFGCDISAFTKIETFKKAAEDISRAVAFLKSKSAEWSLDMDRVILSGSSAGAEAVIHAAYWKDTYLFNGKQILPKDFTYAGVISMAGALKDVMMITADNAIPTQLFHGTCDNTVPYAMAPHHYCDQEDEGYLMLYGGGSIAARLETLNKDYFLVTICGGGHEWAGRPITDNFTDITDFIYHDVLHGMHRKTNRTIVADVQCSQLPDVPVCR